jgi:PAS domain-containing protein
VAKRLLEIRVSERTVENETERRLLDSVLESLPVAVIIADSTGKFVRVNRACYEVYEDVPNESVVEDFPTWAGDWPSTGKRAKPMEWPLSRALFSSESYSEEIQIVRFGDQVRRTLQISSAPVGVDGGVIARVVTGVDVTEQKLVVEALREREQKFRAVFHSQFQFIGLRFESRRASLES